MAYGTVKVDAIQTSTKTVQVDDLAESADLGTAAAEDVGTSAGNVVQLDGSARLPAVDGSQLTNLPSAAGTDLSYTASTRVLASSTGNDATLPEATITEAGLLSAADKTKLDGIAVGAEVNVNADWNASSGDAQILNKPSIPAALDDLGDVDLQTTPPADGEALVYDGVSGTWIPGAAGATAAGSANEIQYNDGSSGLAASADLTWDDTAKELGVGGDINLDDGGTYSTTIQMVTATANRTISFPDATGTVALVAGSSGQVVYNNAGAYAGVSTMTFDGTSVTLAGRLINSYTSLASSPAKVFTGTWFTGGTATTTKPHFLIEPTGTTSTAWSTSGTGLGVNAASGFAGKLLDLQVNGTSQLSVSSLGSPLVGLTSAYNSGTAKGFYFANGQLGFRSTGTGIGVYSRVNNYPGFYFGINVPGAGHSISSDIEFGWSSTSVAGGTADLTFARDAADTLAQRRTTNPQTFRCYGTFTDVSNYVRAALSSTSTAVTLAAETAGTGADDIPLNLTAAGTGTVKVNSVAEVAVSSTVANLPATPVVGMLTRVTDATAPAVGSTVAGGGAAAALVWWNGANWTVIGV